MTTAYKMVIDGSVQVNALSLWFKGGRWAHAFYGSEAPATVPLPHRSVYACIILCDQARCVHAVPTAKMVEQVCSMTCKCAVFFEDNAVFSCTNPTILSPEKEHISSLPLHSIFWAGCRMFKNMVRIVGRGGGITMFWKDTMPLKDEVCNDM